MPSAPGDAAADVGTTVRAHVGCEYECTDGHRFFGHLPVLRFVNAAARAAAQTLRELLAEPTPLTLPCAAEGCAHAAQLQRLFVRTPDSESPLRLTPRIHFAARAPEHDVTARGSANRGAASCSSNGVPATRLRFPPTEASASAHARAVTFSPVVPLMLPRDTFVCMRLPYVYAGPEKVLLTKATASDAQLVCNAMLLPNWLEPA